MAAPQARFDEVAGNENAIMYGGLGYVTDEVKPLGIKKDAGSPAVQASIATVKSGEYPVARPLFVYTNGEPTGVLKAYIDWILGSGGQKIVEELGIDISGQAPKALTQEMVDSATRRISMGCGVEESCPVWARPDEDWDLDDPHHQPIEVVRRIRDQIRERVEMLVEELD